MNRIISLGMLALLSVCCAFAQTKPAPCVWDEKAKPRESNDRVIQNLNIISARVLTDQARLGTFIPVAGSGQQGQSKIYFDARDIVAPVTAGHQVHVSSDKYKFTWMHLYLFVDYNDNGLFEPEEAVAYTHDSTGSTEENRKYFDSTGKEVSPNTNERLQLPIFTLPATLRPGKRLARFKADWDSLDPCGNTTPGNELSKNRGTIVDFYIDVLAPSASEATASISVSHDPKGGDVKIFREDQTELLPKQPVKIGDKLTIQLLPREGYFVRELNQNGLEITSQLKNNEARIVIDSPHTVINVHFMLRNTTSLLSPTAAEPKLYGTPGKLHIYDAPTSEARVYSLSGELVRRVHLLHGQADVTLPRGLYLVRLEGQGRAVLVNCR